LALPVSPKGNGNKSLTLDTFPLFLDFTLLYLVILQSVNLQYIDFPLINRLLSNSSLRLHSAKPICITLHVTPSGSFSYFFSFFPDNYSTYCIFTLVSGRLAGLPTCIQLLQGGSRKTIPKAAAAPRNNITNASSRLLPTSPVSPSLLTAIFGSQHPLLVYTVPQQ
jgi:hypothetical protein